MKRTSVLAVLALAMFLMAPVLTAPAAKAATNNNPVITATIIATQDAYVDSANATTNYGATLLVLGQTSGITQAREIYFGFSLSSIPSNAQITYAYVQLATVYFNFYGTNQFYAVAGIIAGAGPWNQATIDFNNKPATGVFSGGTLTPAAFADVFLKFPVTATAQYLQANPSITYGIAIQGYSTPGGTANPFNATFSSLETASGAPDIRPALVVQYQLPTALVNLSFVCSGGPCESDIYGGSGLPSYLFNVTVSEDNGTFHDVTTPQFTTNISTYLQVHILDYYGNYLAGVGKVVTSTPFFLKVYIPYHLLEIYNQRDEWTQVSVTPAGGEPILFYLWPRSGWVLPLKSSVNYYINFSLLDSAFNIAATINLQRTLSSAAAYTVNGTTLEEVSKNVLGNWGVTNETKATATVIGNIMNRPPAIDFFANLIPGYPELWLLWIPIGLNLWTILLALFIGGWAAFISAYGSEGISNVLSFKKAAASRSKYIKPKVLAAALILLGLVLFLSAVFLGSTGSFNLPIGIGSALVGLGT